MRLIRLLIGMILVFVLVFAGGLFLVPGEKIAKVAADEISRRTGRDVQIGGKARFSLWPNLGVTVDTLKVANADWSANGPMFQAKSVTIGVDAVALVSREIRITALSANAPEILLERNKDGIGNWEMALESPRNANEPATRAEPGATRRISRFTLDRAEITGASVYFLDQVTGNEFSQREIDLILNYPDDTGPAKVDLTLRPAGDPLRLTGEINEPRVLARGQITGVVFDIQGPGAKAHFAGRASIQPEAQGALVVNISDTRALAKALGRGDQGLPTDLWQDLNLAGDITLTREGQVSLRGGKVSLGGNSADVAADLETKGARPMLSAKITAGALDLASFGGGTEVGGDEGAAQTGWSTAPIDAASLGALDAEIAFTAPSIDLGKTKLGTTRAVVTIDRARAVTSLREVQVFGGLVTGEFVANNRNGLSVGGRLAAQEIVLKQALGELVGIHRFTGAASGQVKFLASGQSVAAMMNSLSGEGGLQMGRGTIEGLDLDRLFRGGDPTGGTTIFDATHATFTINEGVLRNRDLLMELAGIEARGEGKIGLGKQDIDYLFTPISLKARDGRGLAIPVAIQGPWAKPRISVDLEKAIELNAAEEKKAVEEKVRNEVKERVRKEFGIVQQDGETAEDAVKRKFEEEAKKGLLKLLGR